MQHTETVHSELLNPTVPAVVEQAPEGVRTAGDFIDSSSGQGALVVEQAADAARPAAVYHSNSLNSVLMDGENSPGVRAIDTESPESPQAGGHSSTDANWARAHRLGGPVIGRSIIK
jgi:hypothetical protein